MNQGSNYSTGMSTDFHLPDEILSVIPTDPYDQLDLARKIASMAIASRVSKLESEIGRLKQKITEKDLLIYELQDKVSQLERAFQEADARLHVALDENTKLSSERDALTIVTKNLNRDLSRLETFKRHLMQSLNDDNVSAETVDIGTCDQSFVKSSTASSLKGQTPRVDGKEFFRRARSRLQYEQFSAFLANIKELNAHRQSREETLRKAEEIFGPDNKDLYLYFQGLLNRSAA